jgi:hypothetical protein
MDPKMRALVDYLRANYRPAATQPVVPPMGDDAYRLDRFLRSAPTRLPRTSSGDRAKAVRSGSGGRTVTSMNPTED